MNFILTLFNIGSELTGLATDPLRREYERLVAVLWATIGLVLAGLVCNVMGLLGVNLILCILFAVVTTILWWRPQQTLWVAAISKATEEKTGGKTLLKRYTLAYRTISLVGTLVFLFLGFIPFKENPIAFFGLIAGTITVTLVIEEWNMAGKFGKKLIFYGVCTIIGACVVSVVPQEMWGESNSFLGEWAASIKAKKSGIFVLIALIATILTLLDERSEAKKENKSGYTWIIVILFILMLTLFKPPALGRLWDGVASSQHTSQQTEAVTPSKHRTGRPQEHVIEVIAEPGVFTEVKIPDNANFTWDCPAEGLVAVIHDGDPQGTVYDCATGDVRLDTNMHGLRLGFSSKEGPVKVTVEITPK